MFKKLLHNLMPYTETGRADDHLHASEITREEPPFCPRKRAYTVSPPDGVSIKPKSKTISTSLAYTFDIGNYVQSRINNVWLRDYMVGHWECEACQQKWTFCGAPKKTCNGKNCTLPTYKEVVFHHPALGFVGSTDGLVYNGTKKLTLGEFKTLDKDEFKKLEAPFTEHRIRTQLYLFLIAESDSIYKNVIDTNEAWVLYTSKAFGIKDEVQAKYNYRDANFSPFKEYKIKRDDNAIAPYLDKVKELNGFLAGGSLPQRICARPEDKVAQACEMCKVCFS